MEKNTSSSKKRSVIWAVAVLGLITAILMAGKTKNSLYRTGVQVLQNRQAYEIEEDMVPNSEPGMMFDEDTMMGGAATSGMMAKTSLPSIAMYPYPRDNALDVPVRSYEKYSNHSLVVDDVSSYMTQIKEYVLSIGGRVLSSSVSVSDDFRYGSMQAKIPVEKFEESQTRITQNVEDVISENYSAQDVTGQVVNTQENLTVLQNQKLELEIQLEEVQTDAERRRIELQISRLETQIRNAESQVTNVQEQVEYATVFIQVSDSDRFFHPRSSQDIGGEFRNAWRSISDVFFLLVRLAVWVIVYGILWLPLVLLLTWLSGKRKN